MTRGKEGMVGGGVAEEVGEGGSAGNWYVGTNSVSVARKGMEMRRAMNGRGVVGDWEVTSKLFGHVYERMQVEAKEHPVLLSEPSFNTSALRERATELLFEEHGVPALFLAKNAVLASFAHGRATSVVLESGASTTAAVPVHDGYVLSKSLIQSPLAGDELTRIYEHIIRSEFGNPLRPSFSISKKVGKDGDVISVSDKPLPGITSSFSSYHAHLLVQDIKEGTTKVFQESNLAIDYSLPSSESSPPLLQYILPDGSSLSPGSWRYRLPEIMFNPSLHTPSSYSSHSSISSLPSVQQMLFQAINSCDSDLKKDLLQNIFITGGNTLFPGFSDRLISELSSLFGPQIKLKNQSLPSPSERKNATFIGASILSSLGTFHQMWMSRQEYDEYGKGLVDRKCP